MILAVVNAIFKQLRKKPEKNSGLQRDLIRDLTIPVRRSNLLSYVFIINEATDVHNCEEHFSFDFISAVLISDLCLIHLWMHI